jgi:hypothetical protein
VLTASFWLLRLPSSLSLLPLRAGVAAVDSAVVIPVDVVVVIVPKRSSVFLFIYLVTTSLVFMSSLVLSALVRLPAFM